MSCRFVAFVLALAAGGFVAGSARPAVAGVSQPSPLQIVSQSVTVDSSQGDARFSLVFNHAPNFGNQDEQGRREDSFQYEIAPGTTDPWNAYKEIRAVVRGDEMTAADFPIRAGFQAPADPDPRSGGWGRILGTSPYTLRDNRLTFTAPLASLDSPDGLFGYRVFTTRFGATTSQAQGSTAIPLPAALWPGLGTLAGMGLLAARRSRA